MSGHATEHMGEFVTRNGTTFTFSVLSQVLLESFHAAVNEAVALGFTMEKAIIAGGWELTFSAAREPGLLTVIKHANPFYQ